MAISSRRMVGDDLAALLEAVQDLGIGPEVHVALAVALIDVRQAVELLRRLEEALAQERQAAFFDPDGDLAGLGLAQLAGGADDVAEVEQLGQRPLVGQQALAQAHLDRAGAVAQGDEDQLADVPQQNDSARAPGPLTLVLVLVPGLHRGRRLDVLVPGAVGINPQGRDLRQLLLSLLLESIRIGLVGQVRTPSKSRSRFRGAKLGPQTHTAFGALFPCAGRVLILRTNSSPQLAARHAAPRPSAGLDQLRLGDQKPDGQLGIGLQRLFDGALR